MGNSRGARVRLTAALLAAVAAPGCSPVATRPRGEIRPAALDRPAFVDVGSQYGLRYQANRARRRPRDILDANGSGCAFLDYDSDGDLDILLAGEPRCALFRNDGERFTDVTTTVGLGAPGHWIGVGAGDLDNDGYPEVCLTGYGCGALFRNERGHFRNVSQASGVVFPHWGESVALADINREGLLDFYLGGYVRYDGHTLRYCRRGPVQAACGPELYTPELGRLFLNVGKLRFREATAESGMSTAHGRAWGAMFQDFDDDGKPDLYVANDMIAGDLFHCTGAGPGAPHYRNVGMSSGTAYDANGNVQGGMAVDWADYDNDGRPDLLVTTYSAQSTSLYHNDGHGSFTESSDTAGVAQPTLPYVGFGARFLDFDNDGWRDLLLANGHILDNAEQVHGGEQYRQPTLLLRNTGGRFSDLSSRMLAGLQPLVARSAAFGDFDNDGRTDVLLMDLEGDPLLLRNQATGGHWLGIRLVGTRSNREGLGARVWVSAGGRRQRFECESSGSVLATSDARVLAGLGGATQVNEITVDWPSGRHSRLRSVEANRYITVREP